MTSSGTEFVIERYHRAFAAVHPDDKAPTITQRGSWFRVVWEKHGSKSCRLEEIARMASVLERRIAQ